jgi:hypothetical protein
MKSLKFSLLKLCAGSILVFPVAVGAQEPQQRRVPTWAQSHLEAGDPSMRALYALAVCARDQRRDAVDAYLDARPGTDEEAAALTRVLPPGRDRCLIMGKTLRIRNSTLLRGALAEAIYNGAKLRPNSSEALPEPQLETIGFRGARDHAVGQWVAICAAHRRPMLAHEVVRHGPGTLGETRALRALEPVFLACLPDGYSLNVSRLAIRALLAESLHRAAQVHKEFFRNA